MNYYNEIDPFAAAWLRGLIKAGHISQGEVDERDIQDVVPSDLRGFKQCHFFAGIGVWSYALRLAGWPDESPVWTGSCPCQPFSVANVWEGGGKGKADERHLLPKFAELIRECKPGAVFGEQVPNAISKGWLDELFVDLERAGYAVAPLVLPASAFGADHERKRLFWVADSRGERWQGHIPVQCVPGSEEKTRSEFSNNFFRARRVMAHDYDALLPCDGSSVVLERSAVKAYGNAIVAPQAAAFISAAMECL